MQPDKDEQRGVALLSKDTHRSSPGSRIDTVLFDFGGTLDADGIAWKDRMYGYYRAEGLNLTADAFAPIFYAADDQLVGTLPRDADLTRTLFHLTDKIEVEIARCTETKSDGRPDGERGLRIATRFLVDSFDVLSRNRTFLATLRRRCRLGIVSNFYGNLEAVCEEVGIASLCDVMVDSDRVGKVKPDPAIFHHALAALDANPKTTLFVGDSLSRDRVGADGVGMPFMWVASASVLTGNMSSGTIPRGGGVVTRVSDLATILL